MIPEKRYQLILQQLQNEGAVKASELAARLGTSYETVRRDLGHLESQGLLRRSSGGAVLNQEASEESSYQRFGARSEQYPDRKREVARLAMRYIAEGDVIALDSGTTALFLARAIRERFQKLTIVTNSLAIANEVTQKEGFTLILTGGVYRPDEGSLIPDIGEPILSHININTFFLTTCGVSVEKGITYQRMDEVPVQKRMVECAERTIAITDSSKLGVNSLIKMCDITAVCCILTDAQATAEQIQPFIAHGIPVIRS